MRNFLIAAIFAVASAGSLPANGQTEAVAKPLRHLEYSFSVDREGVHEYHYNGIGNGIKTSSGVGGISTSEGGRGTIYVDVLSLAPDGALVVKIWELVQNEPRPRDAYTCNVYGSTRVVCPPVPAPSQAQWVLLSYLGRAFVDGAPWDAQHHWRRKEDTPQYSVVEDFTLVGTAGDKHPVIREAKKMEMHNGGFNTRIENIDVTYDEAMEVPDAVRDVVETSGGRGSGNAVFDFKLTADSFVKASQTLHL
jgi:hypothetical protein